MSLDNGTTDPIPILGQNRIVVIMTPGRLANTFDVQIDTSNFQHGMPMAAQCLLQATMFLLPVAFQHISDASRGT